MVLTGKGWFSALFEGGRHPLPPAVFLGKNPPTSSAFWLQGKAFK